MTRERITVKNFGPIQHADIELQDFIVFIGPQASGKSTLAKLIHFFRYIIGEEPFLPASPDKTTLEFKKYFSEMFWQAGGEVSYRYFVEDQEITLKFTNQQLEYSTLRRTISRAVLIPASRAIYSLVSRAMFSLAYENINIDPFILLFGRRMEMIKKRALLTRADEHFAHLMSEILKGKVSVVEGEERIYFTSEDYVELDHASSGQQETVPLLLMLMDAFYSGEEQSITIEEPEAHLFPSSQHHLIEFISRCYNSGLNGGKFVITTHSPYILTSFNNFLFAHQVAGLGRDAASRADAIVPEPARINPENFSAYYIENGVPRSILDKGLISENEIDDASEDIAEVFDRLLDIYRRYSKAV